MSGLNDWERSRTFATFRTWEKEEQRSWDCLFERRKNCFVWILVEDHQHNFSGRLKESVSCSWMLSTELLKSGSENLQSHERETERYCEREKHRIETTGMYTHTTIQRQSDRKEERKRKSVWKEEQTQRNFRHTKIFMTHRYSSFCPYVRTLFSSFRSFTEVHEGAILFHSCLRREK